MVEQCLGAQLGQLVRELKYGEWDIFPILWFRLIASSVDINILVLDGERGNMVGPCEFYGCSSSSIVTIEGALVIGAYRNIRQLVCELCLDCVYLLVIIVLPQIVFLRRLNNLYLHSYC